MASKFSSFVSMLLLFAAATAALATPLQRRDPRCSKTGIRREWRRLTMAEQDSYLAAVQCMMTAPTQKIYPNATGAETRYDDFVATHIIMTPVVHFDGQFLPWHRKFLSVWEQALRNECGYKGSQPYWDWALDHPPAIMANAPIFAAVHGFGGNGAYIPLNASNLPPALGMPPTMPVPTPPPASAFPGRSLADVAELQRMFSRTTAPPVPSPGGVPGEDEMHTGGGCVLDGPYKNLKIRLGPNAALGNNTRCLTRDFAPIFLAAASPEAIDQVLGIPKFGGLAFAMQNLHVVGHGGVGGITGEIGNVFSSANDPLFFMHHTNLDRVWWSWQQGDLAARLKDVSGPSSPLLTDNIGLDFELLIGNMGNATVESIMDLGSYPMCAGYDEVYQLSSSKKDAL